MDTASHSASTTYSVKKPSTWPRVGQALLNPSLSAQHVAAILSTSEVQYAVGTTSIRI